MTELYSRVPSINYPVGMSTRGTILKFLGVTIDDGRQLPRLVILDAEGNVKGSYGWQHEMFQDPRMQESRIWNAIRAVAEPKAAK